MNERFRELADQAKQYADTVARHSTGVKNIPKWNEVYNNKFAELIVRECAGVTDNHLIPDYPITGAVYDGIQSKKILEYFGVES